MSNCRFLTPCGICEIKSSTSGIPYMCELMRDKLEEMPIPKSVEDKTYMDKGESSQVINRAELFE